MNVRNNTYTIYNKHEYELTKNLQDCYMLIYRGEICPDESFVKSRLAENVYIKNLKCNLEITNAYFVNTFAIYKNYKFEIDQIKDNKIRIFNFDFEVSECLKLDTVERGWFEKWVSKEELDLVWEERRPSGFGLPMPEGLERIVELNIWD